MYWINPIVLDLFGCMDNEWLRNYLHWEIKDGVPKAIHKIPKQANRICKIIHQLAEVLKGGMDNFLDVSSLSKNSFWLSRVNDGDTLQSS